MQVLTCVMAWCFLRGWYEVVDGVLMGIGFLGLVDWWICWREGVPGKGSARGCLGVCVGVWGCVGGTKGRYPDRGGEDFEADWCD